MFDIFIVSNFLPCSPQPASAAHAMMMPPTRRALSMPRAWTGAIQTIAPPRVPPVPASQSQIAPHKRCSAHKVSEANAENRVMDKEQRRRPIVDEQLHADARALAISIETIRRARGKKNPRDVDFGTPEWKNTCIEFARDLRWALGIGDDGLTEVRRPDNP
ncbi:hypothetical protein [Caballeronia fortuita]|uniref:hypothetical protein n=1 Tax=Caballeronia fortuita TaxID=1777138 RepID=UPI0012FD6495|nr:hypothetical protein [Caballeronia fortuita]